MNDYLQTLFARSFRSDEMIGNVQPRLPSLFERTANTFQGRDFPFQTTVDTVKEPETRQTSVGDDVNSFVSIVPESEKIERIETQSETRYQSNHRTSGYTPTINPEPQASMNTAPHDSMRSVGNTLAFRPDQTEAVPISVSQGETSETFQNRLSDKQFDKITAPTAHETVRSIEKEIVRINIDESLTSNTSKTAPLVKPLVPELSANRQSPLNVIHKAEVNEFWITPPLGENSEVLAVTPRMPEKLAQQANPRPMNESPADPKPVIQSNTLLPINVIHPLSSLSNPKLRDVGKQLKENNTREQQQPTINVTIGRIEIRATPAVSSQPKKNHRKSSTMSLDEYLNKRSGGTR
ncbi:hypothetical protein [Methylomonas sp. MgM2]